MEVREIAALAGVLREAEVLGRSGRAAARA